jgi:hypothetical protein
VCQGTVLLQNGSSIFVNNLPSGTSVDATVNIYYTSESPPKYSGAQSPPKYSSSIAHIEWMFDSPRRRAHRFSNFNVTHAASQVVGGVQLFEVFDEYII